jgi:hypothetical protein
LSRCGAACAIAGAKNARIKKKLQQCDQVRGCLKTFSFTAGKVRIGYPSPAVPKSISPKAQDFAKYFPGKEQPTGFGSKLQYRNVASMLKAYKAGN